MNLPPEQKFATLLLVLMIFLLTLLGILAFLMLHFLFRRWMAYLKDQSEKIPQPPTTEVSDKGISEREKNAHARSLVEIQVHREMYMFTLRWIVILGLGITLGEALCASVLISRVIGSNQPPSREDKNDGKAGIQTVVTTVNTPQTQDQPSRNSAK